MKQVKFSFKSKLFGRILPCCVLALICVAVAGNWWMASAANSEITHFALAVSGFSLAETARPTNKKPKSFSLLRTFSDSSNSAFGLFPPPPPNPMTKALIRHGFTLNGRIEGSVQQLSGENTIFNSSAALTGDLLVPGSPNLIRNGASTFGGTIIGTGSAQPNNYSLTLNSSSLLGHLLTRTDAVQMPTVSAPPAPTGTRNVTINNSTQSIGDFATLRNLTLNSNVGNKAIPPGTYGSFIANSGSGFILGTAGSSQPTVYNFSSLTLNSTSQLQVAGPVIVTLGAGMTINGAVGSSSNPTWLEVRISSGGLTLNSGSSLYGSVVAPSGTVIVNSLLVGNATADRLTVNSGGVLRILQQGDTTPPIINLQQPADGFVTNAAQVTISGTYSDESQTTITVNNAPVTLNGSNFTATVSLTQGSNTLTILAVDSSSNQTAITRNVVRDSVNPLLTVVEPTDNTFLNTTTLVVLGTVQDQTATTVSVNGVAAALNGNNFTANVPITEGTNTIVSIATDSAGNATQISRQIIRDTIPPVLTIQQPAGNTITPDSTVLVSGTCTDTNPFIIRINGIDAQISGNTYSATVPISSGSSLITVTAVDVARNETSKEHKITSSTALTLKLEEPTDNFVTDSKTVRVEGTVSGVDPHITVNGTSFDLVGGFLFGQNIDLNEGSNTIHVVATDIVGRTQETTRTVVVDTVAPVLTELSPAEGETIDGATVNIHGKINDSTNVTVKINGSPVSVGTDGYFTLTDFLVTEGTNNLMVVATDEVGNTVTDDFSFQGKDHTAPALPVIFPVSQETVMTFVTIEGRAEPGTILTITGGTEPATAEAALGSGLFFANINLASGENELITSARDRAGNNSPAVTFNVTSDPSRNIPSQQPVKINIATNDTQKGLTGQLLPRPLIARVTDKQGLPIGDVPVKFTVLYGDGQLVGGTTEVTVATDPQGQANANFLAGVKTGIQLIRADFQGNLYKSVTFTAEILQSQSNTPTSVTGLVLDQNLRALPNVLVRLGGQQTRTGTNGRFRMNSVQSGPHQLLELIGRDQVPFPGRWTNISYDIDVLPGINNTPGKPLFLPKVNPGINLPLNSQGIVTQDTTYELPVVGGLPPVRVTARAGTQVTFPPDVSDKRFSVTRIDANRVPMALEDGRATNLYISVQPSGAVFEPALEVSFPNLDGLNPNEKSLLMSFDHDAGRYVQVGSAHVSADGAIVKSDPGSGIRVGAWHATPPEDPLPEATVLSFVQIEDNPAFENKDIEVTEATVLGVRAVPYSEENNAQGVISKIHLRGVVSFPRNSRPETSKVLAYTSATDPQLQFAGGSFNPANQDIFLVQDKEVTLPIAILNQQVGNTYTVSCPNPISDQATITTCNNTSLTIKGGPDSFKNAGEKKFKVKVTSTGNGKTEAEIKVNLVRVTYKEDQSKSGFDSLVKGDLQKPKFDASGKYIGDEFEKDKDDDANAKKDPWMTVVLGGDQNNSSQGTPNTVKYEIKPSKAANFIEFVSNDPTNAKLDVSNDAVNKKLSLTGKSIAGGKVSEDLEVNAKFKNTVYGTAGTEAGKLNVAVRLRVKVKVAFYYLGDQDARGLKHHTSGDPSKLDELIKNINDILTPQTGIEYTKTSVYHWEPAKNFPAGNNSTIALLPKDYTDVVSVSPDWVRLSNGDSASSPAPRQTKLCDVNADREVYFVWEFEEGESLPVINGTAQNFVVAAFSANRLLTTIMSETTSDYEALAHEIGHSLIIRPSLAKYQYLDYPLVTPSPSPSPSGSPTPTPTPSPSPDIAHSNVRLELMYSRTVGKWRIPKADVDQAVTLVGITNWKTGGVKKRPC